MLTYLLMRNTTIISHTAEYPTFDSNDTALVVIFVPSLGYDSRVSQYGTLKDELARNTVDSFLRIYPAIHHAFWKAIAERSDERISRVTLVKAYIAARPVDSATAIIVVDALIKHLKERGYEL